jgi:hypothetical protein
MANVKQDGIVFEYPDDVEIPENQKSAIETDEVNVEKEAKPAVKANDIELEIEDDTPPADRNREPLPKNIVEELENDNLDEYSERVKQRLSQMKKVWHDERRAKEQSDREREEAVRYAQQIAYENKKLKSTLSTGEVEYVRTMHKAVEQELLAAKRDYREAYDSGDTDRIIDAQTKMNDAQMRLTQITQYQPQYSTLQNYENDVYIQQNKPLVPKPDQKALRWQDKNDWFGKDEEMTSLALGVHEKLVRSGIDPTSDEYYHRIDSTMQKRFPEYFGDATLDEDTPAQRTKPSTVVAPATRSTAPKKVKLTKTQVALAKKFGITPEQYARETLKLEKLNG